MEQQLDCRNTSTMRRESKPKRSAVIELRDEKGFSNKQLAAAAKIPYQTLMYIINNPLRVPRFDNAMAISAALDTTPDMIFNVD